MLYVECIIATFAVNWCIVKREKCLCMGKLVRIFQLQCLLVQSHYWADDHVAVLKQKSLGQAIMVSDFIEEETADYLLHNGREARLLLETQQDGYFDSDKFLDHRRCFHHGESG